MDAATRTGVVDTSLNLRLVGFSPDYDDAAIREDPGRVPNGVNGGGSAKKESEVPVREFERFVSEKERETLLLVNRFSDRRNEVFLQETQDVAFRKRKVEYCIDEESRKRLRESNRCRIHKVYYRVDASDLILVVKDGYQWTKYGLKVTRGVLQGLVRYLMPSQEEATYEGEHNHRPPSRATTTASLRSDSLASFLSTPSSPSAKSPSPTAASSNSQKTKVEALPMVLIQQMATSLTRDPAFTSAIAAAISGTVLSQMLARTDRD